MRELSIEFRGWELDDVIIKLSEYIKECFNVRSVSFCHSSCCESVVTVDLVEKYKK